MELERAKLMHDAFYTLPSEDPYWEHPNKFPQEIPHRDYVEIHNIEGEDDE
jgi:hypothetical protein